MVEQRYPFRYEIQNNKEKLPYGQLLFNYKGIRQAELPYNLI